MKIEISNRLAIEILNIMALNGNVMSDECREFKKKLEKINNAKKKKMLINIPHFLRLLAGFNDLQN